MGLGFYTGLRNRETRIRQRREALEDRDAANKEWQARFDKQNETAWQLWLDKNKITAEQQIAAEKRAEEADIRAGERRMAAELDVLALKRAYELDDRDAAQAWWKEQQTILNEFAEQKAVDDQNRLIAWDNKKFERDRKARQEDLRAEIGLRTAAANEQFDYQYGIKTETAKEAAIAAHANEMQKILFERVMDGKLVGTDFVAAVGGTTDSKAQILQYSAAIKALGVENDNPVLAQLAGLNNPAVMEATFKTLQQYHTKIVESGQTGPSAIEAFREGANSYLSNLQITSPDPSQANKVIEQMETVLGKPLDLLTQSLIKSTVGTKGSVIAVTEPTLVEPLDVSKLGDWKEVITSNAVARARNEQTLISKAKTAAIEMSKSNNANKQTEGKEMLDWLGTRDLAITEALEAVKTKDYYGVVSLFGNNAIKEAIAEEPKLKSAVIPDYMKQAKDAAPIVVPNNRVLRTLIDYGIVRKGDLVTRPGPDEKPITEPWLGE